MSTGFLNKRIHGLNTPGIQDYASSTALTLDSSLNALFEGQVLNIGAVERTHLSTLNVIEMGENTHISAAVAGNTGGSHFMRGAYHNGTGWRHAGTEEVTAMSFLGTGDIKFRTAAAGVDDASFTWVDALLISNASADIQPQGNVVMSAAKGIDFSANTGAAGEDNSLLDWYEEGTFTTAITTGGGSITVDTTEDTLEYTRIGNVCFVRGKIDITSVSSPTGDLTFSGLPFTSIAGTESSGIVVKPTYVLNPAVAWTSGPNISVNLSATTFDILDGNVGACADHIGASSIFYFEFFYHVA